MNTTTAQPIAPAAGKSSPIPRSRRDDHAVVAIDVGPHALAVRSTDIVAVHDAGEVMPMPPSVSPSLAVSQSSPSPSPSPSQKQSQFQSLSSPQLLSDDAGDAPLQWVRPGQSGVLAAIDVARLIGVRSHRRRRPLVVVRRGDRADDELGLWVDATSRPRQIERSNWHTLPGWVQRSLTLPIDAVVASSRDASGDAASDVASAWRLVVNPRRFAQHRQAPQRSAKTIATAAGAPGHRDDAESSATVNSTSTREPSTRTRGVLMFAPAAIAVDAVGGPAHDQQLSAAVAVPMSCVMGVVRYDTVMPMPVSDPILLGIATWKGCPIPVVDLAAALGLGGERDRMAGGQKRLLILRTAAGEIFGCVAAAQMRRARNLSSVSTALPNSFMPQTFTPQTSTPQTFTPQTSTPQTLTPQTSKPSAMPSSILDDRLLGCFETADGPLLVPNLDLCLPGGPD